MRRNSNRTKRLRIALAVVSALTGIALAVGSNLAAGTEVSVRATVNRNCSVSMSSGFATVRSNVPWEVSVTAASGQTQVIRGGATNGQRIELEPGARVEMVTR